jgi:hypothetical protein
MLRKSTRYFTIGFIVPFMTLSLMLLTLGCTPGYWEDRLSLGVGGGQDAITVHLPFASGYTSRCTQAAGGEYSHSYTSTLFDVDLDTPNDVDDLIFAPAGGVMYVHDDDSETGFGVHANIDQGDGSYLIIGHMAKIFVENGVEVAEGQLIGYEGTTGASSGDHVHLGRHMGDASKDGTLGTSIEGLELQALNTTTGANGPHMTTEMTCSLSGGHVYQSQLPTVLWHPNGTLVKSPGASTIYLVDMGETRAFPSEDVFWSNSHSFDDVVLVSDAELACYEQGVQMGTESKDSAIYMDGTLLTEVSTSTVYVVSDGMAMPIDDWQTFLMMGYQQSNIITVDDGRVAELFDRIGDCGINAYCLDRGDATSCGGSTDEEAVYDKVEDTGVTLPSDTGTTEDEVADLIVYWESPGATVQDAITLSGEYVYASGGSTGWKDWGQVEDESMIARTFTDAQPGDALRFSVEFTSSGHTSWSCLAPFPSGTVQGTVWASYGDRAPSVQAVADPTSDGCGLLVTVP